MLMGTQSSIDQVVECEMCGEYFVPYNNETVCSGDCAYAWVEAFIDLGKEVVKKLRTEDSKEDTNEV